MTWNEAEAAENAADRADGIDGPPDHAGTLMRLLYGHRWAGRLANGQHDEMLAKYVECCVLVGRVRTEAAFRAAALVRAGYGADDIVAASNGVPPPGFDWPAGV